MGRSVLFFIKRRCRRGGEHRVVRHALFREAAVREPVHKRADAREDRNAEEHTQHAAEAAADHDGHDDPEARNAGGFAEDLRPQNIAVKLLQCDDEENEIKALLGADEQDEKRARNGAEERAEDRNDVRHAHEHRNNWRIRELEDRAADEAEDADDERVEQLSAHEAAEDTVSLGHGAQRAAVRRFGQNGVEDLLRLLGKALLAREQIDRDHHADEKVLEEDDDAPDAAGHGDDRDLRLRDDRVGDPLDELIVVAVECGEQLVGVDVVGEDRLILHKAVDPVVDGFIIAFKVVGQCLRAVDQLGDEDAEHQVDEGDDADPRDEDAQPPDERGLDLRQPLLDIPVEKVNDGGEKVREHKAVDDRREHAHQLVEKVQQHAGLEKRVVKYQHRAGRDDQRYAEVKIGFVLLHGLPLFLGKMR